MTNVVQRSVSSYLPFTSAATQRNKTDIKEQKVCLAWHVMVVLGHITTHDRAKSERKAKRSKRMYCILRGVTGLH